MIFFQKEEALGYQILKCLERTKRWHRLKINKIDDKIILVNQMITRIIQMKNGSSIFAENDHQINLNEQTNSKSIFLVLDIILEH